MLATDLQRTLASNSLVTGIYFYPELDSTMNKAWEVARRGGESHGNGTLVVALSQSSGRGRQGRTWESTAGESLLFSLVVSLAGITKRNPDFQASCVTAAVAVALQAALVRYVPAKIKYPNDIVCGGRKLGGILVETAKLQGDTVFVAGVGLNVNQPLEHLPPDTLTPATSLFLESGKLFRLEDVMAAVADELQTVFWQQAAGEVIRTFNEQCVTLGRAVTIDTGNGLLVGEARRIAECGGLVVENDTGEHVIHSGGIVRLHYEQ